MRVGPSDLACLQARLQRGAALGRQGAQLAAHARGALHRGPVVVEAGEVGFGRFVRGSGEEIPAPARDPVIEEYLRRSPQSRRFSMRRR